MPTTRAKRQAQQQSGLPPSPQIVLSETSRRRPRSKKTGRVPEAHETSTSEYVEDPKSEIHTLSLSPAAHPVPGVVPADSIAVSPKLANHPASPVTHPVAARLSDAAATSSSSLQHRSPGSLAHPVHAVAPENPVAQPVQVELFSSPANVPLAPPSTPVTPVEHPVSPACLGNVAPRISPYVTSTPRIPTVPRTRLHLWVDAAQDDLAAAEPSGAPSLVLAIPSSIVPAIIALISQHRVTRSNELTQNADSILSSPSLQKRKLSDAAQMPQPARRVRFGKPLASPPTTNRTRREALSESNLQPKSGLPASSKPQRRTKIQKLDKYDSKGNIQLGGTVEVPIDSDDEGMPFSPPLKENRLVKHHYANLEGTMISGNPYTEEERPRMLKPQLLEDALFDPFSLEHESQTERARDTASAITERESQQDPEARLNPVTPHARRWGLGGLLDSARSVSRFIPLLNTRSTTAAPQVAKDTNRVSYQTPTPAKVIPQILPHTEPRPSTYVIEPSDTPATNEVRAAKRPQSHKATAKGVLKTKQQVSDDRKRRAEREFLREQAEFVRADDARKAQEAKDLEDMRRQAERTATPGGKRKRLPSPDTIPNPPGVSYGMDLNYFCYSSSDEEEQTTPTQRPSNKRRRISIPGSSPGPVIGDPHKARPYTGVYFANSAEKYHGGNIFGEAASTADAASRAADVRLAATSLAPNKDATTATARAAAMGPVKDGVQVTEAELIARGYIGNIPRIHMPGPPPREVNRSSTFTVPDPSDSDSDPEDTEPLVSTPTAPEVSNNPISTGTIQASASRQPAATRSVAPSPIKSSNSWTQPPPPRPHPPHATLPSVSLDEDQLNDAIAKARASAMKHAPTKSSSLRQSSRLSSPRVGADDANQKAVRKRGGHAIQEAQDDVVPSAATTDLTQEVLSATGMEDGADLHEGEVRKGTARTAVAGLEVAYIDKIPVSVKQHTGNDGGATAFTAYEEWRKAANAAVSRLVETTWTEQDTEIAGDDLEAELDAYLANESPDQTESIAFNEGRQAVYNPSPTSERVALEYNGVGNASSAVVRTTEDDSVDLENTEQPDAYATFWQTADPTVMDLLESDWTDKDDEAAAMSLEDELGEFIADQSDGTPEHEWTDEDEDAAVAAFEEEFHANAVDEAATELAVSGSSVTV